MKNDGVYISHMLSIAHRVREKVSTLQRESFLANENLALAVVHLLQTIGEAARLVTDEGKAQYPTIPWRQITGMRHRIVHDYMNVDLEVAWVAASRSVPELITLLEAASPPHSESIK